MFDFFTFIKKEKESYGLQEFYPFCNTEEKRISTGFTKKPTTVINSIYVKKKESKDKSIKNRSSKSNSRSKKSTSKSNSKQHRKNINSNNSIYMTKCK